MSVSEAIVVGRGKSDSIVLGMSASVVGSTAMNGFIMTDRQVHVLRFITVRHDDVLLDTSTLDVDTACCVRGSIHGGGGPDSSRKVAIITPHVRIEVVEFLVLLQGQRRRLCVAGGVSRGLFCHRQIWDTKVHDVSSD